MTKGLGFIAAARIDEHRNLLITNEERFYQLVRRLRPGDYEIEVRKHIETRSAKQNRYYQGVIVKIFADYCSYEHDEAHEVLKFECNPKILIDFETKQERVIGGSTAELSVEEFAKFCQRCQQWIAEHCDGLYVPDPNEEEEAVA